MARIEDADRSLDLTLQGYSHPDAAALANDYDGNWVVVSVRARDAERSWEAEGPAFLTWELIELTGWLRAAAAAGGGQRFFSGFEPYLQFESDADAGTLTAVFGGEFLPPALDRKTEEYPLSFTLEPARVEAFAAGLETEAAAFPIRVVQQDGYAATWQQTQA